MLTHAQIWTAIDRLAARAGLSASGLAKRAGLDPTTFNKSKRITPDGRARWPSTESVSKSLTATGATLDQFVALISDQARPSAEAVPLIAFAEAGASGDEGLVGVRLRDDFVEGEEIVGREFVDAAGGGDEVVDQDDVVDMEI